MSHTPGPWKERNPHKGAWELRCPKGNLVCWVTLAKEKNARLIAAAPDLLAACKAALNIRSTDPDDPRVFEILYNAIAKAEGGAA